MDRCSHPKKDGTACPNAARPGTSFCWAHDPALAEQRAEGRRRGGSAKKAATLPAESPELPLRSVEDILAAVEATFNAVRVGRMDSRVGNCLAVLAQVQLRAIEGSDMERRMTAIEESMRR